MKALPETKKVVQRALRDRGLYHGAIDGIDGPKTWDAIESAVLLSPALAPNPNPFPSKEQEQEQEQDKTDPRSEANIATLLPEVQPLAREFLQRLNLRLSELQNGVTAKIISGTRTYSEQDSLYTQGRTAEGPIVTNARAGYSNHNFGLAFDIGLFAGDGRYRAESSLYDTAGAIGKSLGLEWGGDWQSIEDKPHFQLRPAWALTMSEHDMLAEARRRTANGEAIA